MGLEERVKDNRSILKNKILNYTREAFTIHGIKDVTMDSIATELSVSKRTLYELFGDKEGLLLEIVKQHYLECCDFLNQVSSESDNVLDVIFMIFERNVQEFKKVNRQFFEDINKYPSVVNYIQSTRDEMGAVTISNFHKGVSQGLFRDDVNYDIVKTSMVEEMGVLLSTSLKDKYSLVEIYENMFFMYMRGVATEEGLKKVDEFLSLIKYKGKTTISDNNYK